MLKSVAQYLNSPFECGVCGLKVAANTVACPSCGADDKTGLREDTTDVNTAEELGIFDEESYDYDDVIARELGMDSSGRKVREIHSVWWVTAIVLLLVLLITAFFYQW